MASLSPSECFILSYSYIFLLIKRNNFLDNILKMIIINGFLFEQMHHMTSFSSSLFPYIWWILFLSALLFLQLGEGSWCSGFLLSCPLKPATAQLDLETPWTECVDVSVALSCCCRLAERLKPSIWPVCECECCKLSTLLWEGGCINWSAGTTRDWRRSNWSIASTSPSLSEGILIYITFTGPDGVCRGKVTVWFKSRSLSWEMCSEIWWHIFEHSELLTAI